MRTAYADVNDIDYYDCTGKNDGNYIHPFDCTKFITCQKACHYLHLAPAPETGNIYESVKLKPLIYRLETPSGSPVAYGGKPAYSAGLTGFSRLIENGARSQITFIVILNTIKLNLNSYFGKLS